MSEISPFFVLEAEQLILAELYDDAIELCKTGLEEYPEYVTAWTILARAYEKNGDLHSAQSIVSESKKHHPESKIIHSLELEFSEAETINEIDTEKESLIVNETEDEVHIPDIDSMFLNNKEEIVDQSNDTNDSVEEVNLDNIDIKESIEEVEALEDSLMDEIVEIDEEDNIELIENEKSVEVHEEEYIEESTQNQTIDEVDESKTEIITDEILETEDIVSEEIVASEIIEDSKIEIESVKKEFYIEKGFLFDFVSKKEVKTNASKINAVYGLDAVLNKNISIEQFERYSFRDIIIADVVDIKTPVFEQKAIFEIPKFNESKSPFESKLADLAKKLEEVSIPIIHEEEEEPLIEDYNSKPSIVSETMANIYLQQGAYEEAAKAYKELLIQNPDKKDYFISKLRTLIPKMK